MRTAPDRSPFLAFATAVACFVGGPLLGAAVAYGVAPDSHTAQVLTPLLFLIAFTAGLFVWFGFGVVAVLGGGLRRLARGRRTPLPEGTLVPPGYGAFVPLAVICSLVAGLAAAITSDASLVTAGGAHVGAGIAYGLALRALAHGGYLPFPEPE